MSDAAEPVPTGIPTEFWYGAKQRVPVRLLEGAFAGGRGDLTIEVGPDQWKTVDMIMLFHLEWGNRNEGEIVEGGDVRIEARLDPEYYPQLIEALDAADSDDLIAVLAALDADDPLKRTESWYGLRVTENVPLPPELAAKGEVRSGFTTVWND